MLKLLIAAAALSLAAAPAFAADVTGEWLVQGGSAKVKIAPCGQTLCGTINWLKEPTTKAGAPKTDQNNPNASLKSRPIVGLQMLTGFKPAGENKWGGGKIYDPESGKTYDSKMTLQPNGNLKVEGCVSIICRGVTWTRAS
ncbi:DUF2147 domain-containing protein [Phenylobacterium deserti]|uniref:DUF2147 domain-containing protein n=1 Tax=Phenylobacterium deserti TaxID=1914756 RepID=A0A328ASF2_9CAUL|nr:DUF2147 domain-containing protein [Phenylobacterium deserti]RAK57993.1 DUF2147 domain-containing protein [Phenylobacterium deserti]